MLFVYIFLFNANNVNERQSGWTLHTFCVNCPFFLNGTQSTVIFLSPPLSSTTPWTLAISNTKKKHTNRFWMFWIRVWHYKTAFYTGHYVCFSAIFSIWPFLLFNFPFFVLCLRCSGYSIHLIVDSCVIRPCKMESV